MRRSRRAAIYAVVTGLLTAGMLTAAIPAAYANVAGFCNGSGTTATCTLTDDAITAPTAITVDVNASVNGEATVAWTVTCTLADTTLYTTGSTMAETPAQVALTPLPTTAAGQCSVSASISLPTDDSSNALIGELTYTPAVSPSSSPSPSPSPSPSHRATVAGYHQWLGYDGKCLDDPRNSSALRARVQIWTCGSSDKAEYWDYTRGELTIHGLCLNDQHWGASGSHAILFTCDGAANEIWSELANGEFKLRAHGGKYCLTDPAYSTRKGTQLIISACRDSSNQRWYQGI